MPENKIMVALGGVSKAFEGENVVNKITANIREGEFFSLLGPSGCGKTTLLRMIAGFETPESGSIMINGKDVTHSNAEDRPTNMVFQNYAIFPHLNVEDNVAYGLKIRKIPKEKRAILVNRMLALVDLKGYNKRSAQSLSGGQRQRVALARALVLEPKVLLLDEPLSALDKKLREHMQDELRRLQRSVGITFILVTHDQEEALIMSDRIAVMFNGKIAQLDTPAKIYKQPVNKKVASFIGVMNFLDGQLIAGEKGEAVVETKLLGRVALTQQQAAKQLKLGAVSIGIRPEMLTLLLNESDRSEFEFAAEILGSSYYGDVTYYHVKCKASDDELMVLERNDMGQAVLEAGMDVRIGWGAASIVLLDDDAAIKD